MGDLMYSDWRTSRYSFGATPPCSAGWTTAVASQISPHSPPSAVAAIKALSVEEADALAAAALNGTLRGSVMFENLLYQMFPAPFVPPEGVAVTLAAAIEEVISTHCPVDTSMKPPSDDGSSSMRASNEKKSAFPLIAVAAVAILMLS